jgi:hypothetical protein
MHTSTCSHTSYNRLLEATVTKCGAPLHCAALPVAAKSFAAVLTTPRTSALRGITADAHTAHYS